MMQTILSTCLQTNKKLRNLENSFNEFKNYTIESKMDEIFAKSQISKNQITDYMDWDEIFAKSQTSKNQITDYMGWDEIFAKSQISKNHITDYIENGEELERGNGQVVKKIMNGVQSVAQKKITPEEIKKINQEIFILTELRNCTNVITFYGTMQVKGERYMILEWAETDLNNYLKTNPHLSWDFKLKIASEIASGLAFCHFRNISHNDIRSHNILLTENITAKLSNFNHSREVSDYLLKNRWRSSEKLANQALYPKEYGKYRWRSPEKLANQEIYSNECDIYRWRSPEKLVNQEIYSKECDIYSFSIVLWELASQDMPFVDITNKQDLINHVTLQKGRPLLISGTPKLFEKIMEHGWSQKPEERPAADEIFRNLKSLVCKKAYIQKETEIISFKEEIQEEQKIHQEHTNLQKTNSSKEFLHQNARNDAVKYHKLDHGLVIKSQVMCATVNKAFDFKLETKGAINICHVKLASPKDDDELFLLKNHIDIDSFQSLPQKLINIIMQSINFFNDKDKSLFNNVYFETNFPEIELNFEKRTIKPTEELKIAVDNALKNKKPYQELIKVFDEFGYLLSQKLILGQKLYKSCVLLQKPPCSNGQQSEFKLEIENFTQELDDIYQRNVGSTQPILISMDGEAIKINDIKKWLNEHSKPLEIIKRGEFLPLYEIFEESISHKIQSILGIDNQKKILMTGIMQINKNNKYYHIDFPSHLESCNYQIFANVIKDGNEPLIHKVVKAYSKSRTGFFAEIKNLNETENIDSNDFQIMWMLVGFSDEINFYSVQTRELYVLSMEHQDISHDKKSVSINVPEKLPINSIMALSFEYPLHSKNATIQDGKIELNITHNPPKDTSGSDKYKNIEFENDESESENDESKDENSD
ncbi:kinase-like protein [Gigaspora margarita]|nr:kinase-like protein [Gigaspora margarita]